VFFGKRKLLKTSDKRNRKLMLILLMDLTSDGKSLGQGSLGRLEMGAAWAKAFGYEVCVAATFSPAHPKQEVAMSTMAAGWLGNLLRPLVVHDLVGACSFNTRGELTKLLAFAEKAGISQLAVATAWWHIPRVVGMYNIFMAQQQIRLFLWVCRQK